MYIANDMNRTVDNRLNVHADLPAKTSCMTRFTNDFYELTTTTTNVDVDAKPFKFAGGRLIFYISIFFFVSPQMHKQHANPMKTELLEA